MIAKYRPVPIVVGVVPREARGSIGFPRRAIPGRQVARQLMLPQSFPPS